MRTRRKVLSLVLMICALLMICPAAEAAAKATIKLSSKKMTLYVKASKTLKATVKGKSQKVTWKSSKPSVAAVKKGKVTAKKAGKAQITATANGVSAICDVTVKVPTIKLNKSSLTLQTGKKTTLKATVKGPSKSVTWNTSSKKIATVTKKGVVKGIKAGTAVITATANGVSAICIVTVEKNEEPAPGPAVVKDVSCGYDHTAILKTDGTLWMCGYNNKGQLGDGTTAMHDTPVQVMEGVKKAYAGKEITAIIKTDDSLWICGTGYLGDGSYSTQLKPVKIMSNVKDISLGEDYAAIVKKDHTLWTFGKNDLGQLGDGTLIERRTPVKIMTGVEKVDAGCYYVEDATSSPQTLGPTTVILKQDGTLWMCGDNRNFQYGTGDTTSQYFPIQTPHRNVADVLIDSGGVLMLKKDGTLWCCGNNDTGSLGNGGKRSTWGIMPKVPTPVQVMSKVKAISMGNRSTLVLKKDGTLWACGSIKGGSSSLSQVASDVTAMSTTRAWYAYVKTDGSLWVCANTNGVTSPALGNGFRNAPEPMRIM